MAFSMASAGSGVEQFGRLIESGEDVAQVTQGAAFLRCLGLDRVDANAEPDRLRAEEFGIATAASPATWNVSGFAAMMSSAWVPMDPVEPRMEDAGHGETCQVSRPASKLARSGGRFLVAFTCARARSS